MWVPGRTRTYSVACAAVRVIRGSTTIMLARLSTPCDRVGMTDPRLMIGIIGAPKGRKLAVEVGGLIGEFRRAQPVHRVRSRPLANLQKLVANLVDGRFPGDASPLTIHQLHGIAQAALAQHVVADSRALAAMRVPIDRAVVIRLLADPHTICDFGDH